MPSMQIRVCYLVAVAVLFLVISLAGCNARAWKREPSEAEGITTTPLRDSTKPGDTVFDPVGDWFLDGKSASTLKLTGASTALDMGCSVVLSFSASDGRELKCCFLAPDPDTRADRCQGIVIFWRGRWAAREEVAPGSRLEAQIIRMLRGQRNQSFDIKLVKNASSAIDLLANRDQPWPPRSAWYLDWGASHAQREFDLRHAPEMRRENP